jgi:hypothetical protein
MHAGVGDAEPLLASSSSGSSSSSGGDGEGAANGQVEHGCSTGQPSGDGVRLDCEAYARMLRWSACTVRGFADGTLIFKFDTVDPWEPWEALERSSANGEPRRRRRGEVGQGEGSDEEDVALLQSSRGTWRNALRLGLKFPSQIEKTLQKLEAYTEQLRQRPQDLGTAEQLDYPQWKTYRKASLRRMRAEVGGAVTGAAAALDGSGGVREVGQGRESVDATGGAGPGSSPEPGSVGEWDGTASLPQAPPSKLRQKRAGAPAGLRVRAGGSGCSDSDGEEGVVAAGEGKEGSGGKSETGEGSDARVSSSSGRKAQIPGINGSSGAGSNGNEQLTEEGRDVSSNGKAPPGTLHTSPAVQDPQGLLGLMLRAAALAVIRSEAVGASICFLL